MEDTGTELDEVTHIHRLPEEDLVHLDCGRWGRRGGYQAALLGYSWSDALKGRRQAQPWVLWGRCLHAPANNPDQAPTPLTYRAWGGFLTACRQSRWPAQMLAC